MSVTGRAGLGRELGDGAVVVEAGQRREPLGRDVGGVAQGDQAVGVGRVAGDADAYVVRGDLVERLALLGEDRAVGRQQLAALHARAARAGADEQAEVDAVEDLARVGADLDPGERRERAVVELHHDALEGLQCWLDLQQPQLDRTVGAEQRTAREPEQQAVADLAGGTGDGDLERGPNISWGHDELLGCGNGSDASSHRHWGILGRVSLWAAAIGGARRGRARLLCLGSTGCGAAGQANPEKIGPRGVDELVIPTPDPDPDDFVDAVTNPWLPLAPGTVWTYDVAGSEVQQLEVRVEERRRVVAGVACVVVHSTGTDRDGRGRRPGGRLLRAGHPRQRVALRGGEPGPGAHDSGPHPLLECR